MAFDTPPVTANTTGPLIVTPLPDTLTPPVPAASPATLMSKYVVPVVAVEPLSTVRLASAALPPTTPLKYVLPAVATVRADPPSSGPPKPMGAPPVLCRVVPPVSPGGARGRAPKELPSR